jgi:hypothetical protein
MIYLYKYWHTILSVQWILFKSKGKAITSSQSQSYITTDCQTASLPWCQAPIWDPRPIFFLLSLIIFRQLWICWCWAPSVLKAQVILLPTVSRLVRRGVRPPWGPWPDFNFLYLTITFFLLYVGRPPWREDGSVIWSAITYWLESLRTHNLILLSHLRLSQPGGSCII